MYEFSTNRPTQQPLRANTMRKSHTKITAHHKFFTTFAASTVVLPSKGGERKRESRENRLQFPLL